MNNLPNIPLSIQKDIEQLQSWEGFTSPHDFALYCARILSVDPNRFLSFKDIIVSNLEPADKTKLWIKTDSPYAIGLPVGDSKFEIFYQWPRNTAILWVGKKRGLPDELRALTTSELEDLSLTDPADDKGTWAIFEV